MRELTLLWLRAGVSVPWLLVAGMRKRRVGDRGRDRTCVRDHVMRRTRYYSAVVTRSADTLQGQSLADAFATDAPAAAVRVLREARGAKLSAIAIKKALEVGGVPRSVVDAEWRKVQQRIKTHENVVADGRAYRWTSDGQSAPAVVALESPLEAFERIVRGRLPAAKRSALVAVVRAALDGHSPSLAVGDSVTREDPEEAARQRQRAIDAIRSLAELATEVEELAVNEAEADVMIHRVRARVKRSGLEPIDRAGDETRFDRKRHKPIGGSISDGVTVVVVRPGYVWKAPAEDVLIGRAVVIE
jgi:hypothetical protein